jgi:hypothetical protein
MTGRWLQKAGVFRIGSDDSSLKMALDEMLVALAFLDRTMTRRQQSLVSLACSYPVDVHGCDQLYAITHISLRFIFLCNQFFVLG